MQRRALTAVLSSAALALTGAVAATSVPTAQAAEAADPGSPLVLDAPGRVVVRSHDGWVYSDLGVRMTARGQDFEIRAKRTPTGEASWWDTSYNSPISATWQREGDDVALPEGSMTTWAGLDDFATVRIIRTGRDRWIKTAGCFNGSSRKVGPGAPTGPTTYPWGCPWNPYTLGSVMGVAQDHQSTLLPEWGTSLRLRPGSYEMVARISRKWRRVFGISRVDGVVSSTLVVEKARERRWGRESATSVPARGTDNLEPTTEAPTAESAGDPVNEFAPDLRSLPAFDISLNRKGTAMRFGATVWNGGGGPMVIEGFREEHDHAARSGPGEHEAHMTAYQYYFDGNGNQTGYDQVGEFNYHAANHNHWHFRDFARYRLFAADPANPGQPGEVAVRSTKASFCLVATDAVDLTVPHADMRPQYTDLGSQCGGRRSQMLRQVLANGHGDTYHQFRAGQAFRIGNIPDGTYFVSVEANPDDRNGRNLMELDDTNNDSLRKVRIWTNAKGVRKVRAARVGIVDELDFGGFFRR